MSMRMTVDWLKDVLAGWRWWMLALAFAGLVVVLAVVGSALGDLGFIGLFSNLVALALLPVAVAVLFIGLRVADRLGGIPWDRLRGKILAEPLTASIYATGRWIALAIIISAVLR